MAITLNKFNGPDLMSAVHPPRPRCTGPSPLLRARSGHPRHDAERRNPRESTLPEAASESYCRRVRAHCLTFYNLGTDASLAQSNTILVAAGTGMSSRKNAPYTLWVFFFMAIGNFLSPSDSKPLSWSTRASSPARARS